MSRITDRILMAAAFCLLSAMAFGQDQSTARPGSPTLVQLFPDLIQLSGTTSLTVSMGWQGLSLISPVSAACSLVLRDDAFVCDGRFSAATASATRPVTIPRSIVHSFLETASKAPLEEKGYSPRIMVTDSYPFFTVSVRTNQGLLRIETQSQPQRPASGTHIDRSPWGIYYMGRQFVVTVSDLDIAVDALEYHLLRSKVLDALARQVQSGAPTRR